MHVVLLMAERPPTGQLSLIVSSWLYPRKSPAKPAGEHDTILMKLRDKLMHLRSRGDRLFQSELLRIPFDHWRVKHSTRGGYMREGLLLCALEVLQEQSLKFKGHLFSRAKIPRTKERNADGNIEARMLDNTEASAQWVCPQKASP
jgi:hypothetical protein